LSKIFWGQAYWTLTVQTPAREGYVQTAQPVPDSSSWTS